MISPIHRAQAPESATPAMAAEAKLSTSRGLFKGAALRWPGMPTGTVKWFSEEKGYGFITPDEGDKDVFVHRTGVTPDAGGTLADGAKVSFETEDGEKGPKAVDVKPL